MGKIAPTPLAANLVKAGWGYPLLATKGHYFKEGESVSICGRWMFTGERYDEKPAPFHCKACLKKLEKLNG